MLALLLGYAIAKAPSNLDEENFSTESEENRPVIVVGSYLGLLWLLHNKKDHLPVLKTTANSNMHNIPTLVIGYGDIFANHFYLGLEGEVGYGLKRGKESTGTTEKTGWHIGGFGHAGFHLSPSARLYSVIGFDKTNHSYEDGTSKASADGFALSVGGGLLVTMSSRFGFGVEGRYVPQKSWSGPLKDAGTKVSAWQMGIKVILFI